MKIRVNEHYIIARCKLYFYYKQLHELKTRKKHEITRRIIKAILIIICVILFLVIGSSFIIIL